jgi:hydroxyacylglutathione hydrolase
LEGLINDDLFRVQNGLFPSNTYFLKSSLSRDCIIIDPGLDKIAIQKKLVELSLNPIAIMSTHGHFDHIGSVSYFKVKYNIPFYLHRSDVKLSKSANFFLTIAKIPIQIDTPIPDVIIEGKEQTITINEFKLGVYNLPGHSAGSCVIQNEKYLFSGDIMYKKGLGLNNFPGEDKIKLKSSIHEIFRLFENDSLILPGHGEFEYLGNIAQSNQDLIRFLM